MPEGKQDEGKRPGFKVSDRRSFADLSPPAADITAESPTESPAAANQDWEPPTSVDAAHETGPAPQSGPPPSDLDALPPVDFHTFILSLGSSALLHLGELDHPDGREARPDLRLAKHTIDIIGMLQEKTRGNLTAPEARLIESLLYDLRLRFVERGKSPQEKK